MATLKLAIRNQKITKDGKAIVYIYLQHNNKHQYISTGISVPAKDFVGGVLRGRANATTFAKLTAILNQYEERLEQIENIGAKDAAQVKEDLLEENPLRYHKISECYESFYEHLKEGNSKTTYRTSLALFKMFCKGRDVNIEAVDTRFVRNYNQWLHETEPMRTSRSKQNSDRGKLKRHYSDASICCYLAHLKAVINHAISEGWVSYKVHPFSKTVVGGKLVRHTNIISAFDFKKIKDYTCADAVKQEAVDIFVLSFCLGGMNPADLVNVDFRKKTIIYEREKVASRTKGTATVTIPVLPQAKRIADKYMDKTTGKLSITTKNLHNVVASYNYHIKTVATELGIDSHITFTSARKAFAQIGTDLGFNDNLLNYLLGHSMASSRGMMNPYSMPQEKLAAEILKVIIEFSDHPDKIEEVFYNNLENTLKFLHK